jgi:triacylglycerol esterase/lipase EstA (alpha/beta hydrolase family)
MKKAIKLSLVGAAALLAVSVASAEVIFQQVVSGNYGQASVYTADGFAAVNVSVDGSGTAFLAAYSSNSTDGYKLWYGNIPASAVTVRGVNTIAVQIDTCSVDPTAGCGYVDAVMTTDPQAGGFITEGSSQYNWDGVIMQVAGPTQVHNADATGYVNGVSLDGARAAVGKYTNVSIMIETAQ